MRKLDSQIYHFVNNVNSYNFIIINYKGNLIERFNNKNIYIYLIKTSQNRDDLVYLYNKSNKYYRLIIKNKDEPVFTLVNEYYDVKVKDFFLFSDLLFQNRDEYPLSNFESEIIEIIKKIDN